LANFIVSHFWRI